VDVVHVLICGDNTPASNARMLQLVDEALSLRPFAVRFTFKPHKAAPVDESRCAALGIELRNGELSEMLRDCHLVLTGSLTSAAVDAYCVGKPVASLLDGRTLNGSPLRGLPGIRYFATAQELVDILTFVPRLDLQSSTGREATYFWLDPSLPRWRRLLSVQST
jgi:surface carbohydrate biosynthesis protein (TIGR04326 family)